MKILTLLFISSLSLATTTLTGVAGASKAERQTDGSWIVYGGIQLNAAPATYSCSDTAACDTCNGSVANGPCNLNGVFDSTKVTLTGTTSVTTTGAKWLLCNSTTEIDHSVDLSTGLQPTWEKICANTDCATDVNVSYQFGVGTSCNDIGTEKVNVRFITRGVDTQTASTYTPPPITNPVVPADCTTDHGACFFKMFPGDGKVYIDDDVGLGIAADFPSTSGSTDVKYSNLVFFFKKTGTTDDDSSADIATYGSITTADDLGTISVSDDGSVENQSVDGLENDARYCFKMASQDTAGNIDHISSADCTVAGVYNDPASDCRNVCTTPSEVLGLLTDKNCFIATAAFGSRFDQHVQTLRNFKNEFMATHWIGRKMIQAYYKISPPIAKWIAQREWARTAVRGMLWPILGWVELCFALGWFGVMLPFLILGSGLVIRRRFVS